MVLLVVEALVAETRAELQARSKLKDKHDDGSPVLGPREQIELSLRQVLENESDIETELEQAALKQQHQDELARYNAMIAARNENGRVSDSGRWVVTDDEDR